MFNSDGKSAHFRKGISARRIGWATEEKENDTEHQKNNLPDVLARWKERTGIERSNPRTAQSFCVTVGEIRDTGTWDFSMDRYKDFEYEEVEYDPPSEIISELKNLEAEIAEKLSEIERALKWNGPNWDFRTNVRSGLAKLQNEKKKSIGRMEPTLGSLFRICPASAN